MDRTLTAVPSKATDTTNNKENNDMEATKSVIEEVTVDAVRLKQGDITLYLTAMSAETLLKITEVDEWDPEFEPVTKDDIFRQGYQRDPAKSHYIKVARYLARDASPLLPTSVFLSARQELTFSDGDGDDPIAQGTLQLQSGTLPLFIIDGQHRLAGLRYAIEELEIGDLGEYPIPVTIMELTGTRGKLEEVKQFYTLNATAKRVRTDLAERLLLMLSEVDPEFEEEMIRQHRKWKLRGTKILQVLNDRPGSPWYRRIKKPNSPRGEGVASETTVRTSLKPLLTGGFTAEVDNETIVKLISNLWNALEELMPEAFKDPGDYVIQKSPGTFTIHMVAPRIFELCRQQNDYSVKTIKEILTATMEAEQYFANEEFWRGQALDGEGAASYNGMGGFAQLANEIQQGLPQINVQIDI